MTRKRAGIAVAAAVLLAAMILPLNTAHAEECVPQERVVTEITLENGMPRIKSYSFGYCSPWKAIADGLSAAIVESYRTKGGKIMLGAAMNAMRDRADTSTVTAIANSTVKK